MKIWRLDSDVNNFDNIAPIHSRDWEVLRFDGRRLKENWTQVSVRIIDEIKQSDSPGLSSSCPVFSERAVETLKDLIGDSVEILPLKCRKGKYFAINVVNLLNCIDYDHAEFKRFPSSDKIMRFTKYSFKPQYLAGSHIFKIIDEPRSYPFVTEEFIKRVKESDLQGFKFEEVWNSEK